MSIIDVAWRAGGFAVLTALGEDNDGSGMLRDAITTFAQNGGAAYVSETIESLFPNSDSPLTNNQLAALADELVENWQP
jgi:hypothetical protein